MDSSRFIWHEEQVRCRRANEKKRESAPVCRHACAHVCRRVRRHVCGHACLSYLRVRIDMRIVVAHGTVSCVLTCMQMGTGMCLEMRMDLWSYRAILFINQYRASLGMEEFGSSVSRHVYRHVHRRAYRYVHRHAYGHVCGHAHRHGFGMCRAPSRKLFLAPSRKLFLAPSRKVLASTGTPSARQLGRPSAMPTGCGTVGYLGGE